MNENKDIGALKDEVAGRFVYISPYYDPDVHSGANRRFDELVWRFKRDFGDKFTLIVAKGKAPHGWDGNLIEIPYKFDLLSKFISTYEIGKALDKLPPSVVICESLPIPFRAMRRHVHFQVAYDFRYFTGKSKGFFYRLVFSSFLRREWGRSQYMVTCSDFSIDELKKYVGYDPKKVIKSFFGIDDRVMETAKNNAPEKSIDVLYVGHFEKRKNHMPLIKAISLVNKDLRTVFVGVDNGLQKSLEEYAKSVGLTNTLFTKIKDDNELWNTYRKSRVFAFPSIYEGFGIPLIEALALGVPVICSDVPVFHEVGDKFATYFDPYNPEDIAEKLKEQFSKPYLPPEKELRSHLEQFFWENIYKKFVEDLQKTVRE